MGGKKGGENTRKAAGNAKKAEAAARKQASLDAKSAAAEDREWSKGAKSNAKKEAEADKKAEAARKKAEREALLAEEEKSQPSTPKNANAKTATKKSKGTLDLSQLDSPSSPSTDTTTDTKTAPTLNATGIDNALDALDLTVDSGTSIKIDRHPERRFGAAYCAYQKRELDEVTKQNPGLSRHKRLEICRKQFEISEENPFRQAGAVAWNASREEIRAKKDQVRKGVEGRLAEK